jgi:error-prone DNA polymerase
MGWHNPPVSWRELERRLSWNVTQLPPRPEQDRSPRDRGGTPEGELPWAELHCHSSYSFLDGASSPGELVAEAVRLGLRGLAVTDHDGMYGVAQFAQAAAGHDLATIFGAELSLSSPEERAGAPDPGGRHLLVLARDVAGYKRLSAVISAAQLGGGAKGRLVYDADALGQAHDGHWVVLTGCRKAAVPAALTDGGPAAALAELRKLTAMFGKENVFTELTFHDQPGDDERNDLLAGLAGAAGVGLVATGNVHYATPARARLAETLAAIRARRSLTEMDGWLPASGSAYLRSGAEMSRRLRRFPGVQQRTVELAGACAFGFGDLAPNLPDFPVPEGYDEMSWLRALVAEQAPKRYGPPGAEWQAGAYRQIEHELAVIGQLGFPGYFLLVHDIVRFCENQRILCQGRGSAANSAVCYALGITSVDAVRHALLFERFLSSGRDGPPDIDLDIEHRRREEVIQYVYDRYGRDRAAQVANVITYRPRMALRDAGRALGHPQPELNAWSHRAGPGEVADGDAGVPEDVAALAGQLARLPRHLGIHSGGMVICDRPVSDVCPVEWARMPGRSVLQWDKDDCAYAGLVKFDLLGLGMLSALHDCFDLVETHYGHSWTLNSIPQEDPAVYRMLQAADTVGVFQVESRAQMSTLPRLRPEKFYDLVVEVALIRPGPIQGGSVHPYLRRRAGDEERLIPHESMRGALEKTFGVPLFQEQMMQLAIDCAGFSPAEADKLRQAMSSKRAPERVEELRQRLLDGMADRGISGEVAEDVYQKILAFSSYGFPESHAISFAYLVYASAWLKHYYPAAFTAALLRCQPMGFYSPASLISDVRRHGVEVRGVDVNISSDLATLEGRRASQPAIRLGLRGVRHLGADPAAAVAAGRPYQDLEDFARRTRLSPPALEALAAAGAFGCFGPGRREAMWAAGAAAAIRPAQLPGSTPGLTAPALPAMTPEEETVADLWATGIYGTHPLVHLRSGLDADGVLSATGLAVAPPGDRVVVGGLVTHRQRPETAGGVVFMSLEDETGMVNVICPPHVWARYRRIGAESGALLVHGRVERTEGATNLVASRLRRLRVAAAPPSRDFR